MDPTFVALLGRIAGVTPVVARAAKPLMFRALSAPSFQSHAIGLLERREPGGGFFGFSEVAGWTLVCRGTLARALAYRVAFAMASA